MAKEWIVSDEDLGCDGAYYSHKELIRCKDCIWKYGSDCTRFAEVYVKPDDFCSRGEAKTKRSEHEKKQS